MLIDLNSCFPAPLDPETPQGPLPKQQQFLNLALAPDIPKYIRYVGGIGSGKSLIGCITVLSWAVQYPGTYLISRQFMPELRDTTYKTFLEVCPKELIVKHHIAESTITIKSNGGLAVILFRGLEEPDKLRSLNLNAFYIDEANQVKEHAFTLLQGRLRGRYVRKGIITQNSGGHDWSWRWFVKKDLFKTKLAMSQFVNISAPSTENVHLPPDYVSTILDTWTPERIQREIYANEDSFEGMVYHEFRYDIHVIQPFRLDENWTRTIGADHGYRNPACWIWGAVDGDENIYIYKEFYEREWVIDEICNGKIDKLTGERIPDKPGIYQLLGGKIPEGAWMDPSTKREEGQGKGGSAKSESIWDLYLKALPDDFPLLPANRKKKAGIDRVKQYMKVNPHTKRPKLFIFNTCTHLIDEISRYRYAEIPLSRVGTVAEKEEPMKIDDHACDALRYLIMSRPEPYVSPEDWYKERKVDYNSLEGRLHRDLEAIRKPRVADPFED
jgi:phage terminase large subunit